jgi:hypothetical protein
VEELTDMSLFERARDVLAAKASKALDAAEKPGGPAAEAGS